MNHANSLAAPQSAVRWGRNLFSLLAALGISSASVLADWKPVDETLLTEWGRDLQPEEVWQEYPRPQMKREGWSNLNGLWSYAITGRDVSQPQQWDGEILVPFAPEAKLSGVGRLLEPEQALWYRRSFESKGKERTILHFEAVDYQATVWVNGVEVGSHTGGHTPFSFDISMALKKGENDILVRVFDATEGFQLHGKQKLAPGGIWYTRVSGIWQTVWLEEVPLRYIRDLDYTCDIFAGTLTVSAKLTGPEHPNEKIRVTALFDGEEVRSETGVDQVTLTLPDARLWSPEEPNLYQLKVELLGEGGQLLDEVASYAALRQFGKKRDSAGNLRFTLNEKPIFHWGPLDQGWWPDGLLTPPSDAAMRSDIDYLKAAGFNMIRKHIKVEPRRYYAYCDQVGMLMWQDHVSQGYGPQTEPQGSNPRWSRLAPNPEEGNWPSDAHEQFVTEYKRMVDHLRDHPCIAVWVPFNEAWGQHQTLEVGEMAVAYDSTRAINIASGGNFWEIGDIADEHAYPDPAFPLGDSSFNDFVKVVGEFGGHGWPVEGHLWKKDSRNWGYGGLPKDLDEWKKRYEDSISKLIYLRKRGVSAGVYTQTSDVEVEINGLLTYDRLPKVDSAWLKEQSDRLLSTPDIVKVEVLTPTSQEEAQSWHYRTDAPSEGWELADFDDSDWKVGEGGFGTRETPMTHVRTKWDDTEIWLRRKFELASEPKGKVLLRLFHDEDAEIYLNGILVGKVAGYATGYLDIPLLDESALKVGENVLAVHCRQTYGGQYIDVGLVDEIAQ
ncbi:glycoside hydrolase family 2 protein [Roseibacillus persicicus]|uniref:Hydrolase n=1 Tax=Roseibacillus persicicus TaxID=454148 RepID=A0A918TKK7_9BACT|nr:sugar-binding domain-containing protein [Roseibacillus persicicus]GHC50352.1 hydrolase [Roseibacillus persicicus]